MARDLLPVSLNLPPDLLAEIDGASDTLAAAKAGSTQKAYASDWVRFCDFCDERNVEALTAHPDIVALFAHVEAEAGIAPVTIGRRVAAIKHHHKEAGFASLTARDAAGVIAQMMAGVRRKYARKKEQKAPAEAAVLETVTGSGLRAVRDRAILAVGMAGAFRRSELTAMNLPDLAFGLEGVRITVPRSKRDQEMHGETVTKATACSDRRDDMDQYRNLAACHTCALRQRCTPEKVKRVMRWRHEGVLDVMQARLDHMPDAMIQRRKTVEHVFGTLKSWSSSAQFFSKTLEKVRTEMSLSVLAYNIKRMIQLFGVQSLIQAIRT